jgi:hypothetical protein
LTVKSPGDGASAASSGRVCGAADGVCWALDIAGNMQAITYVKTTLIANSMDSRIVTRPRLVPSCDSEAAAVTDQ